MITFNNLDFNLLLMKHYFIKELLTFTQVETFQV